MDSFASTFEKVIAETSNLTEDEIEDVRDLYNILAMPLGGLDLKQATHMMAMLGYRGCDFPDEDIFSFERILEMVAKKKDALTSVEAQYQQTFRLMDIRNVGYATSQDLKSYLMHAGVAISDSDVEHLTEIISSSFPDKFDENDFVHYMISYASLKLAEEQRASQLKNQKGKVKVKKR